MKTTEEIIAEIKEHLKDQHVAFKFCPQMEESIYVGLKDSIISKLSELEKAIKEACHDCKFR